MIPGAIVLAGGRGSRLGGMDKRALTLDGETLQGRALRAVAGLPAVVVGPEQQGGPAAAAVAGVAALPGVDEVLLLAVDVPGLPSAVPALLAATAGPDGVVAVDAGGRMQWLLGRYRADALRESAARRADWTDRSLRELLGGLDVAALPLPPESTRDVDTVADARAAGVRLPGEECP